MCIPVSSNDTLQGAICADQTLTELMSEAEFLQIGESSYAFMVDTTTRILYHPYIQYPTEIDNSPRFTYIEDVEISPSVIENMIKAIYLRFDMKFRNSYTVLVC